MNPVTILIVVLLSIFILVLLLIGESGGIKTDKYKITEEYYNKDERRIKTIRIYRYYFLTGWCLYVDNISSVKKAREIVDDLLCKYDKTIAIIDGNKKEDISLEKEKL